MDGDGVMKNLAPSSFFASNVLGSARPLSRLLVPYSSSLFVHRVSFRSLPALLVVFRGVGRGVVCRAVERCDVACRSFPHVGQRSGG